MMRTLIFAAALTVSGVAIAQDQTTQSQSQTPTQSQTTTNPEQPSGQTVDDPSQATGPQGVTQQGTDPNGQATPPAGTNEGVQGTTGAGMAAQPAPSQQAAFTARPAAQEYPPCSRTVTDSCVQTYERGVRRRPRG